MSNIILSGQDAIDLWLQGKDAWNQWVAENPEADISFQGVDFGQYNLPEISFAGFEFPKGNIDFTRATFGGEDVDFSHAIFGEGNVFFDDTTFGDGDVFFHKTAFGNGDVFFHKTTFGDGDVSFDDTTFGDGDVFFNDATFGDGDIFFHKTAFGEGSVFFHRTTLGDGNFFLSDATFGDGDISFRSATFGKGGVYFYGITFGKGDINFTDVINKNGHLLWEKIFLSENNTLNFSNLKVDGRFRFTIDPKCLDYHITEFSLRHATHEGPVDIDASFDCIPDLRGSKTSHHVDFSKVLIKQTAYQTLDRNEDFTEKASKLCRLKEIAENNKDHGAALRFHAAERRTIRHSGTLPRISQFIDLSFDKMSHYGQSLERPLIGLGTVFATFWWIYIIFATLEKCKIPVLTSISEAFSLSLSSMLAFLPISRDMRQDATTILFGDNPAWYIDLLFLNQAGLSFLFLFLLGLGLRNRFRL